VVKSDSLTLKYYVLGKNRTLVEQSSKFCIHSIVPIKGIYADRYLMPAFPGLADQTSCRDWEPGIPIDLDLIRPADEGYWDTFGGIPKAFVTSNAAQNMWENRFGQTTAFRIVESDTVKIKSKLEQNLEPVSSGFIFRPVLEQGLKAGTESVDFAQLFIGLSFFIIVGAMLLTGLLFLFNLEKRDAEQGLYRTFGFSDKDIQRLFFAEGAILTIPGAAIGIVLAFLYNQIIIIALKTVWNDIVGTSHISMFIQIETIITGTIISILIAWVTIWIIVKRRSRINIIQLVQRYGITKKPMNRIVNHAILIGSLVCVAAAIYLVTSTSPGKDKDAAATFFLAGFLVLSSGIMLCIFLLNRQRLSISRFKLNIRQLGLSNLARNKSRSLVLVALLSSGLFIIFTVGSNRQGLQKDLQNRASGTGGFALFAESLIPVLQNLNSRSGREFYSLDQEKLQETQIVSFRVREGDDASCLNLNRISRPGIIAVDPAELSARGSFSFVSTIQNADTTDPWSLLDDTSDERVIPGIADETVIIWGLGKSVGDTLFYFDEFGKPFKVRLVAGLANSIFQGNIIISDSHFSARYPSISGKRMFLIDTPIEKLQAVRGELTWRTHLGFAGSRF